VSLLSNKISATSWIETGVAKVDITPAHPIHLNGHSVRLDECSEIERRLRAEALALGTDQEGACLLLTVDNIGVPRHLTEALFQRLAGKCGLRRENLAVCSTHTHHAPMLSGVLPNLFSRDILPDHLARIEDYTRHLLDRLEEVALAALAARRPAQVGWAKGKVEFAKNRRTPGGPVDHGLPMLRAVSPEGNVRAIFTSYACHCTTVEYQFNKFHGDWAGEAKRAIEEAHPGVIAMVAIGCGADAGPRPHKTLELARQHGESVATEVNRLLRQDLRPLPQKPAGRIQILSLPFQQLPTRQQWTERAREEGIVGYHARKNLARLDRGERLPEVLPYSVQTWQFGSDLAMVFLAGEVVVDYALRLREQIDPARLWVNAYANDVPCYIPSRRILDEGGYEAETSLWYYDQPAKLTADTENLILGAVCTQLPLFQRATAEEAPLHASRESSAPSDQAGGSPKV
jgi:hypothetical protein